jgi:hypothetical protein
MKDLCVPVPNFGEDQIASIILKVGDEEIEYNFRVVSFPWDIEDELTDKEDELHNSLARIIRLKNSIENYDKEWELVQIYTPLENAKFIQVLYRKRKKHTRSA